MSKKKRTKQQKPHTTSATTKPVPSHARVSKKQQRLATRAKETRLKQLRLVGIGAIVLFVFVVIAVWRNAGVPPVEEVIAATVPNLDGPVEAPVQIVEFGDFGCPSCRAWHNSGIKAQLQAEFGDQISFEFRHFPVITAQSPKAAEAAQCAAEQEAFWAYHDYIYESAPPQALAVVDLKSYATAVGLDRDSFDHCLDSDKYRDYVIREQRDAVSVGARGTPSFYINGEPVFFSYEAMAEAITTILDS